MELSVNNAHPFPSWASSSAGSLILGISISSYQGTASGADFVHAELSKGWPKGQSLVEGVFPPVLTFADSNHQANTESWTGEPFPAQFSNTNSPREMGMSSSQRIPVWGNSNCLCQSLQAHSNWAGKRCFRCFPTDLPWKTWPPHLASGAAGSAAGQWLHDLSPASEQRRKNTFIITPLFTPHFTQSSVSLQENHEFHGEVAKQGVQRLLSFISSDIRNQLIWLWFINTCITKRFLIKSFLISQTEP